MGEAQRTSMRVDSAQFFLFHPNDFPDADGEIDVPDEAFEQGLVIGLHLGADGNKIIVLWEGALPEADIEPVPFVFKLHVRHGRLYATDRVEGLRAYNWSKEPCLEIASGMYRAEMYVLKGEVVATYNALWLLRLAPIDRAMFDAMLAWHELPFEDGPRSPA